ncbi:hypothetical protein IG631_16975 [Alternaria alternata]|nr:hypothetical protein IG631_16975 [Alternaria alternata]
MRMLTAVGSNNIGSGVLYYKVRTSPCQPLCLEPSGLGLFPLRSRNRVVEMVWGDRAGITEAARQLCHHLEVPRRGVGFFGVVDVSRCKNTSSNSLMSDG